MERGFQVKKLCKMNKTNTLKFARLIAFLTGCGLIMAFLPPVVNYTAMMLIFAFGCYEIATVKTEQP
jgi:hypothetical protein